MIIACLLNLFISISCRVVCVIPEVSRPFHATKDMVVLQF